MQANKNIEIQESFLNQKKKKWNSRLLHHPHITYIYIYIYIIRVDLFLSGRWWVKLRVETYRRVLLVVVSCKDQTWDTNSFYGLWKWHVHVTCDSVLFQFDRFTRKSIICIHTRGILIYVQKHQKFFPYIVHGRVPRSHRVRFR